MGYFEIPIIAGLILINGFFVTVEFALVKVRATQIEQLAEEGNWAAKLTKARSTVSISICRLPRSESMCEPALGRAMHDWVEPMVESGFHSLGVRATPIASSAFRSPR